MDTPDEIGELTERILRAAHRPSGAPAAPREALPAGSLPPVPAKLPAPPSPVAATGLAAAATGGELPLEEAASMVARARAKTQVSEAVPAVLRRLYRNQGGFNGILVEAVGRLIEMNRQLRGQNQEMQERLLALHGWTQAATQTQAQQRDWTAAADARLRAAPEERIAQLEERLRNLEQRVNPNP